MGLMLAEHLPGDQNAWQEIVTQTIKKVPDYGYSLYPERQQAAAEILAAVTRMLPFKNFDAMVGFVWQVANSAGPEPVSLVKSFLKKMYPVEKELRTAFLAQATALVPAAKAQDLLAREFAVRAGDPPHILLNRTEVRTALGVAPRPFNHDYYSHWYQPICLGELLKEAGLEQGQYPKELLEQKIWIRNMHKWTYSPSLRPKLAQQVLNRSTLKTLLGLAPSEMKTRKISLRALVDTLPKNNQIRQKVSLLANVGFYNDPSATIRSLLGGVDRNKKRFPNTMGNHLAAYLIVTHFSRQDNCFRAAAKDTLSILRSIAPNDPKLYGKVVAWAANAIFHDQNIKYHGSWPLFDVGIIKAEVQLVSALSLLLELDELPDYFIGCLDIHSGSFYYREVDACLQLLETERGIKNADLPEAFVQRIKYRC